MSKAIEAKNQEFPVELIEVSKLAKSSLNARKSVAKGADEELKASILAHGLMQNLIVVEGKKGKYEVIAGARRMEALKALQGEGKLPADQAVLCQIVSEECAYEMSLAENTVRHAMHPADEHAAFVVLINGGSTIEEIAQRFGKTAKYVEQRLKLGRAAPELIQAYRDGKMTLDVLEAYTITDDRKRQMKVFNSLKNNSWEKNDPRHIRRLLTEGSVDAKSKLATFVGLETYEKAGGEVRRDLFKEDVYLENPELLQALAEEKLKLEKQKLEAEGWAWVETAVEQDYSFTNSMNELAPEPVDAPQELIDQRAAIEAEKVELDQQWEAASEDDDELLDSLRDQMDEAEKRLGEIDEKLETFVRFTPEQIKASGCYAYIDHRGELAIEKGLVIPKADDEANEEGDEADQDEASETPEKPKGLSQSLLSDIKAFRLGAAQAEIAKHPAIAFDLLVFKAAKGILAVRPGYDGPEISFTRNFGGMVSKDARDFVAEQASVSAKELPKAWLDAEDEAEQFAAFQRLTEYQKQALLAHCVAVTLKPKLAPEGKPETAYDLALAETGANVADYWRPSATNFLSRVTTDQLLEIGAEIFGESWSSHRRNAKKSNLVSELDKAFAEPEKHGKTPEQVAKLKNWLPAGMGFGEPPAEAKPAKAKKGKKAA